MYALSPYSPVYKEIKKLESDSKIKQFDAYIVRFGGIFWDLLLTTKSSEKEVFSDLVRRYKRCCRDRIWDPSATHLSIVDKLHCPDGLTPNSRFIYNAFSIYGPAKLRKALDL